MKKAAATGPALRERGVPDEEPVLEPWVEAMVSWDDARTVGDVLAMSSEEFRRWKAFVQDRRTVGDD